MKTIIIILAICTVLMISGCSETKVQIDYPVESSTTILGLPETNIVIDVQPFSDEKISESFDVTVQTIERVRKELVEEGLEAVLSRHPYTQKVSRKKIDGDVEAYLIALCCSDPPGGRVRWTLRLLADKVVELGYIDSISYEAIRQTLKKTNLNLG